MRVAFMVNRELRKLPDGRIQMFQTTSEPSPISRTYSDTVRGRNALAKYLAANHTTFADNRATVEEWLAIMDSACPLVDMAGTVRT